MTLTIEFTDEQFRRLEERARALGVSVEQLAQASLLDLIEQPDEAFDAAAQHVLKKNRSLYERLR